MTSTQARGMLATVSVKLNYENHVIFTLNLNRCGILEFIGNEIRKNQLLHFMSLLRLMNVLHTTNERTYNK